MKKLLLITTVLLLSLSAWTQDLDYYRSLFPEESSVTVHDALLNEHNQEFILVSWKGTLSLGGGSSLESPTPNKYSFAVINYKDTWDGFAVVLRSVQSSTVNINPSKGLKFVKTDKGLCVMGSTSGSGDLQLEYVDKYMPVYSEIKTISSGKKGLFMIFLTRCTKQSYSHPYYGEAYDLKKFLVYEYSNSTVLNLNFLDYYKVNDSYTYYNAFVFGGSFKGSLTMGGNTITSQPGVEEPFIGKIILYGNSTIIHSYSFLKKLKVYSPSSEDYARIYDIAINNNDIVVVGAFGGTLETNPDSHSSTYDISTSSQTFFVARYGRVNLAYQAKYKLTEENDYADYVRPKIISDVDGNFYLSMEVITTSVFDIDFKSSNIVNCVNNLDNSFVAKYNASLDYQWYVRASSRIGAPQIGIDSENRLCLLDFFSGSHNYDINGSTPTYYPEGMDLFLGKYNTSDGTLISGNVMHTNTAGSSGNRSAFLAMNKASSKMSIVSYAKRVDHDLGIGEEIVNYNSETWFLSSYNNCDRTNISNLTPKTVCEESTLESDYLSISGTGSIYYSWLKDGDVLQNGTFDEGLITNADTRYLKISNVTPEATGNYQLEVTSRCDIPRYTNTTNFTVTPITHITQEPNGQIICEGSSASFSVNADNSPTYQWQVNDGSGGFVNMPGKTSATLNLNDVDLNMAGYQYRCKVTGQESCNEVYTNTVNLGVKATPQIQVQPQSNTETCEGTSATISVVTNGSGLSYQWQVSTNNGSSFSNISDGADYSGTQNATLDINNPTLAYNDRIYRCVVSGECGNDVISNGAGLSVQKQVQLNTHPENQSLCQYEDATFSVNAEGDGLEYAWQIKNGSNWVNLNNDNTYSNVSNPSLDVHSAGTDMNGNLYRCRISSPCSTPIYSNSATLNVTEVPIFSLSSSEGSDICDGNTTTLSSDIGNGSYTYQWKRNSSSVSGESNSSLIASQSGFYSLYVEENTSGCSFESDPIEINVHALPNNNITLIGSNIFCEGLSAELTVPAGNGYAYQWYQNDTPIEGQNSNSLTVTESGAYHAQISDTYGCQNTSSDEIITVNPSPELSLTVTNSEICQGTETTISTEENSDYFYQWLHNNSEIPGATSHSVQVSEAGLYKVSVINTATGCSGVSDYTVVSVNPLPNPELSVSGTLTVCVEDSVELSLNESYSQYLWQDQSSNDNLYISESGVYSVTVTDENNCQNSAEIEINEILVPTPDICMVTVDTAINKNLIIWENVPNARGIASYNVYKLAANTYQLLGNVQYGDTTEFVDMTSEPHIHSDKYVIASVDSCGNVGEYSPYHQTMNLSIVNGAGDDEDNGVVLIWTKYIDESGFNNPTEYEIYRGVDELTYHASVTGGLSDYNYNIPDAEESEHFLIVVQRPSGCFPLNGVNELKANGGPYYNSVSNMEDEGLLISGIKNTESSLFRIYPNPAKDRISIESDNHIERIRILDISGKVLLEQKANAEKAFNLDLSDFAKGLYFIEVNGQKAKLIKE